MKNKIVAILAVSLLIATLIIPISNAECVKLDNAKSDFVKMKGIELQEANIINGIVNDYIDHPKINVQEVSATSEIIFTPPYDDGGAGVDGIYDPADFDKWDMSGDADKNTGICKVRTTCVDASPGWVSVVAGVVGITSSSKTFEEPAVDIYFLANFAILCGTGWSGYSEFKVLCTYYEDGDYVYGATLDAWRRTSGSEDYNVDRTDLPVTVYLPRFTSGKTYQIWVWAFAKTESYGSGWSYVDGGFTSGSGRMTEVTKIVLYDHAAPIDVCLTPDYYNFGDVELGECSSDKSISLRNYGERSAYIEEVKMTIMTGHAFEITQGLSNYWLKPEESKTIKVKFCPDRKGDNAGILAAVVMLSHDPTAELRGTGHDSCCFPAGTRITMADGSNKSIEDIHFGDRVLSYDINNHEFTSWRVKLLGNPIHPVYEINDGLLSFTKDHPIRVKKPDGTTGWGAVDINAAKSFTRLKNDVLTIEVEDQVYTADEEWIEITNIEFKPEPVQTYNIMSFSGTKTYFANDVLVFEENPPLSIWRANNFYIRGYIDAWINALLDVYLLFYTNSERSE